MSAKLIQNPDGANFQAQAVLAMVRYLIGDGIEASYDAVESHRYLAEPYFARFDNGREQGYVVYMRDAGLNHQINITFYEHRNSDAIYIQINDKRTFNAPILNDIIETWTNKWDAAHICKPGEVMKAARFIVDKLEAFWKEHSAKPEQGAQ